MEKYKKYFGLIIFVLAIVAVTFATIVGFVQPTIKAYNELIANEEQIAQTLSQKQTAKSNIVKKIAKLKESVLTSQKKIYSPVESKLDDDTLFFTLYTDLIDMVHSNSIKIDSIEYKYNPSGDDFVNQNGRYFVCDVNLKLVSNYINLGKFIQDVYQYPYYIRINDIDIYPYPKDKKILLTSMSVRLYAHTSPDENLDIEEENSSINGAETPLPKE